jgi:hypothetical protein
MTDHTATTHRRVDRPVRGAEHNRRLPGADGQVPAKSLLPTLEPGVTLLDIETDGRGVPVVQSLVCDHLLFHEGEAFWVDTAGFGTTTGMARLAPSRRLLDRIHVARGFTAYQHYSILGDLTTAIEQAHREADEWTDTGPSLVVVPAIDGQYRDSDTLGQADARTLHARALAVCADAADRYDVPVLVTRTSQNGIGEAVERAADRRLECTQTELGPRFVGEEFETLAYSVDAGGGYQTTLAYWRQLLATRVQQADTVPAPEPAAQPTGGVGTGVTTTGDSITPTASPVRDLFHAGGE